MFKLNALRIVKGIFTTIAMMAIIGVIGCEGGCKNGYTTFLQAFLLTLACIGVAIVSGTISYLLGNYMKSLKRHTVIPRHQTVKKVPVHTDTFWDDYFEKKGL